MIYAHKIVHIYLPIGSNIVYNRRNATIFYLKVNTYCCPGFTLVLWVYKNIVVWFQCSMVSMTVLFREISHKKVCLLSYT